jgi:predicted patatin/cPLA2 family phospholipase
MLQRSVAAVIAERATGQTRRDDERLALVVECGGMRGVVAAGMLTALSDCNLRPVFDSFHGSSAGACAAAFFMSNQAADGCQIYLEDICTPEFISMTRLLKGMSPVATEAIVDSVMFARRKLDMSMLLGAESLHISCTHADTGVEQVFHQFSTQEQLADTLKATLELPSLKRRGYPIDGVPYIDGGYSAPIAFQSAIASGATHALVLCTQRSQDYVTSERGHPMEGILLGLRYGSKVMNAYRHAQQERVAYVKGHKEAGLACDVIMRAPSGTYCSNLEIQQDVLRRAMHEGEAAARSYLSKLTSH